MPRIRCLYLDCTFLENQYCTASSIEIDPDMGCTTYAPGGDINLLDDDDDWDNEDDDYEAWDTEGLDLDDDDDDDDFDEDEDDW